VRNALDGGDTAGALSDLDRFERRFPARRLGPEAMALRIEGLAMQGDMKAARSLADHFDKAYPDSPYRARLHSVLVGPAGARLSAAAGR
jgi:outer membrane protein assembly factor BamD (BamD/ComL family)